MLTALAAMGLLSCDNDTSAGLTRITYYPVITVLGDATTIVSKGEPYVDAGVYIELEGNDVSNQVVVTGSVNTNVCGIYTINYKSGANADGFFATASRTVIVENAAVTANIAGTYAVTADSYRELLSSGAQVAFGNRYNISITRVAAGFFAVSDFFGGWYAQRAAYGATYAMTGYILLNEDNSIELLSSHVNGWGDALDDLNNGSYNPGNNSIHWDVTYAGAYTWFIDLEKQ